MGLGTREILLIIRGQDELSRVLTTLGRNFSTLSAGAQAAAQKQIALGGAVSTVGVGMAAVGATALKWIGDSISYTNNFKQQVAQVKTQVDDVAVSQQQLGDVTKNVARNIAVPLDTLNASLFDIFSSMDVNVPQAQQLLTGFAKEAVAGQVDVQTAGRATIAIMNAWHLPIDDVNHVLDVQFQLVKKGVGTFQEFATSIGQAIPSAQRAGQSIETLSGMMAFLTRNGLSAAGASASAARALDAFDNPKVVQRLQNMGISVTDSSGNFRDFTLVIQDLQKKLANLTAPERSKALQELFLGAGGTIQARRFFDTVLNSGQAVQQFTGLVNDMKNSSGALGTAYGTMSGTVASKTQVLKNQYDLLKVSVGEALTPVFNTLIPILQKIFNWWNSLSDGTKRNIIIIAAITAAVFTLGGALILLVGIFITFSGAAALMGTSLLGAMGSVLLIVAAIAALVAVGILVYKNWNTIVNNIKTVWGPVIRAFGDAWNWLLNNVLKPVYNWIVEQIGKKLGDIWHQISKDVGTAVDTVGRKIHEGFTAVSNFIKQIWGDVAGWTKQHWDSIKAFVKIFTDWFTAIWPYIKDAVSQNLKLIVNIFSDLWGTIAGVAKGIWTALVGIFQGLWEAIKGIVLGIIHTIEGIIGFLIDVFTGKWSKVLDDIGNIFKGAWEIITGLFWGVVDALGGIFHGLWDVLAAVATGIWKSIGDIFQAGIKILVDAWNAFTGTLKHTWDVVWNSITQFIDLTFGNIAKKFNEAKSTIGGVLKDVVNGGIIGPINWVIEFVYNEGLAAVWNWIVDHIGYSDLEFPHADTIPHLASGGYVSGPGGPTDDSVPAWLSNGEYVVSAKQVSKYLPLLQLINAGKYASGGLVGNPAAYRNDLNNALDAANATPRQRQILTHPETPYYGSPFVTSNQLSTVSTHVSYSLIGGVVRHVAQAFSDTLKQLLPAIGQKISDFVNAGNSGLAAHTKEISYAASQIASFGWAPSELAPLVALWNKESGWDPNAVNPSSGAYGIPQALGHGHPYNLGDYVAQINWGLNYIKGRYGSPSAAWAHEVAHNWYDFGGWVPRGISVVANGTSGDERLGILNRTQWSVLNQLASGGDGASLSDTGNNYNITVQGINIYTNEIDPQQHARELAYYLVSGGVK